MRAVDTKCVVNAVVLGGVVTVVVSAALDVICTLSDVVSGAVVTAVLSRFVDFLAATGY